MRGDLLADAMHGKQLELFSAGAARRSGVLPPRLSLSNSYCTRPAKIRARKWASPPVKLCAAIRSAACCDTATAKRPDVLLHRTAAAASRLFMRCVQETFRAPAPMRRSEYCARSLPET